MSKKYKEVMNNIVVTEEMKIRVLKNIKDTNFEKRKIISFLFYKRFIAVTACSVLLIFGTISLKNFYTPIQNENPSEIQSGILNITKVSSLKELSHIVGFDVQKLKNIPFDVSEIQYVTYNGELAEVKYIGKSQNLVFHKVVGNIDPLGDFTKYSDTLKLTINDISVLLKGEESKYYLAVCQDEIYSYSIKSSIPLSKSEWEKILSDL